MIKLTLGIKLHFDKDKKFYGSFAKGFKSPDPCGPQFYFHPLPGSNLHVVTRDITPSRTYRFFFLIGDVIYEKENKDRPKD